MKYSVRADDTISPSELTRNWWSGGLVREPNKRLKNSSCGLESSPMEEKINKKNTIIRKYYKKYQTSNVLDTS